MLRTKEDRQQAKASRMKKHIGVTKQRFQIQSQEVCACTEPKQRPEVESEDLTSTTPMIATMLDPRHKHLRFLVPASRISAHSKLLELAMAKHVSCTSRDEATTGDDVQVQGAALQKHTSAMTLLLGENNTISCNNDIEKEVDMFLKDPSPVLDSSPTEWWKVNEGRFPRLANVAR